MSSEYVSLAVVRELLETQERVFKQFIELHTSSVKEEIHSLRKYVDDLKNSLAFSQKDIDDVKEKCFRAEERLMDVEDSIALNLTGINELHDKQEYLENHSRGNNVKIFGIPEKDPKEGRETWEESEEKAKEAIRTNLKITEVINIDRAHRVGKPRPQFRHVEGSKIKSDPRPIIVRFQQWKEKERVVKAARQIRPKGLKFFEDFSTRTLQRRKGRIPDLIKARKQGKKRFWLETG